MIKDDWGRLLPGDERVPLVAGASAPALDLVARLAEAGRLRFRAGGRAVLHDHCHAKALGFAAATLRALATVPDLELEVLDAGCCGMSGVFGYEADHFELSVAIGERVLLPAVRREPAETAVLATGTSCRSQIHDLSGRRALHPLEFLAEGRAGQSPGGRGLGGGRRITDSARGEVGPAIAGTPAAGVPA